MSASYEDPTITSTAKTREASIRAAIWEGKLAAAATGEPFTIACCVGVPCTGSLDGCQLCEQITCFPNGTVDRLITRN